MVRILLPLVAPCAFATAPDKSAKIEIDRQTNDFISSDLYRSHVRSEYADVDRFVHSSELSGSAGDESDFFCIHVTDHISRIRALFSRVPDDREGITIPDWNAEYKPQIHRALYDFHTDVVSQTFRGNSALAKVVKQLHFFFTVVDAQAVDEILEVKAKVLRYLDLIMSVRETGNYTENKARQLAGFMDYAENKFYFMLEDCDLARVSIEATDTYKFDTLSSLLAIARGLEFFAPDCDFAPFRDEIQRVNKLSCDFIRGTAPHFIQTTRSKVAKLQEIVFQSTSQL